MLWVNGHYKYFTRQILTSYVDPAAKKINALPYRIEFFTHLKVCLATASHNVKSVKSLIISVQLESKPVPI